MRTYTRIVHLGGARNWFHAADVVQTMFVFLKSLAPANMFSVLAQSAFPFRSGLLLALPSSPLPFLSPERPSKNE